jgi:tetratricopeptide (TPR) repeat protein
MAVMKTFALWVPALLPVVLALPVRAQMTAHMSAQTNSQMHRSSVAAVTPERLGTVSFPVSCNLSSQTSFNRGVALLHDFWYEEAQKQFDALVKSDPSCAMAHWGAAMSGFHQIWDRPDAEGMKTGWAQMEQAQSLKAGTPRERAYITALSDFYRPGAEAYPARIDRYSAAMGALYAKYPDDVNAGAFYALSLLAARSPDDTGQGPNRKAMAVLTPLFAKYPDNPGVVHYIIHACDNPAMAPEGLAAANHYGEIAQDGPHAFHMPGHIYARLGLWPQDIASQLGSIAASQRAELHGESGVMDEPHSYDFLAYAYLQSGQDKRAKAAVEASAEPLKRIGSMQGGGAGRMGGMIPYYQTKLPVFYNLEMREWSKVAAMEPVAGSSPEVSVLVYWARAEADGRLRQPKRAEADLQRYDALMSEVKKSKRAYTVEGTGPKIERGEMVAWVAFAGGKQPEALAAMGAAANLQDKVGQGEVDIPAREMLADMLLDFGKPKEALAQYEVALRLSPNRLNGLYNAGRAAEAAGDKQKADFYYAALLKSTNDGADSSRSEFAHAKSFVSATQVAAK